MALAVVFTPPCLLEIADPGFDLADDLDRLPMLDKSLRERVDGHRQDGRFGIQSISMAAEAVADRILQKAMDQDDVAAGELLAPRHPLFDELAIMADELEIEALHVPAGAALAGCRGFDVPKPPAEGEIGRFDRVLKQRSVDFGRDCVDKGGVPLELREPQRRAKPFQHSVHHVGDDVLRVVEFGRFKKFGVAGDVGDQKQAGSGVGNIVPSFLETRPVRFCRPREATSRRSPNGEPTKVSSRSRSDRPARFPIVRAAQLCAEPPPSGEIAFGFLRQLLQFRHGLLNGSVLRVVVPNRGDPLDVARGDRHVFDVRALGFQELVDLLLQKLDCCVRALGK